MSGLLEVQGLTRRFGHLTAVDDVSFSVGRGEIWGFIGPNGAGKTTTMRVCATLDVPDAGDVLLSGESIVLQPEAARRRMGFMPDTLGAYNAMTVWEYLDFFARCVGLGGQARADRIAAVCDFTDLGDLQERPCDGLSKGMGQRLCLAKTLLHDPELLILDEPASGLDPRARIELRDLVRSLADAGKGVLISSHILSELSEICDGVVLIERAQIVRQGKLDELAQGLSEHGLLFLRALAPLDVLERALAEAPRVQSWRPEANGLMVEFDGDDEAVASLLESLVSQGLRPVESRWHQADLEDLFLSFTKGAVQ